MSVRAWPRLLLLLVATAGCTVGEDTTADLADTDMRDTDTRDSDPPDTADTASADTDPADTDDTDAVDTDVADTDPGAFAVTIAPAHPTTLDDLVATVENIPPGIGGLPGLLIVWSSPGRDPVFGSTVDDARTEAGDTWTVTVHPVAATAIADVEATVTIGP